MSEEKIPDNVRVLSLGKQSPRQLLQEILEKEADDIEDFVIIAKKLDGDSVMACTSRCMTFFALSKTVLERVVMECLGVHFDE